MQRCCKRRRADAANTPTPRLYATPSSRHRRDATPSQRAVAATHNNYYNIRLLRIPIIVRQRVDVDVVVRALEIQVLALHI